MNDKSTLNTEAMCVCDMFVFAHIFVHERINTFSAIHTNMWAITATHVLPIHILIYTGAVDTMYSYYSCMRRPHESNILELQKDRNLMFKSCIT